MYTRVSNLQLPVPCRTSDTILWPFKNLLISFRFICFLDAKMETTPGVTFSANMYLVFFPSHSLNQFKEPLETCPPLSICMLSFISLASNYMLMMTPGSKSSSGRVKGSML